MISWCWRLRIRGDMREGGDVDGIPCRSKGTIFLVRHYWIEKISMVLITFLVYLLGLP